MSAANVRAVIVAAGGANYGSLREACRRIGVEADISDDPQRIRDATHVILPGVGAAAQAMHGLRERGLDRVLRNLAQPLLGVCLGMQLLHESSDEAPVAEHHSHPNAPGPQAQPSGVQRRAGQRSANAPLQPFEGEDFQVAADAAITECLGLLRGRVSRLPAAPRWPHMGWNTLQPPASPHPLLAGIATHAWFYFVHGYAAPVSSDTIVAAEHGYPFAAAVARGNVYGVQFHPEKSAAAGRHLLANFFALT